MATRSKGEDAEPPSWWPLLIVSIAVAVAIAVGQLTTTSLAEAAGATVGALMTALVYGWKYRRKLWFVSFVGFIAAIHGLALALVPWPTNHFITKLDGALCVADFTLVLVLLAALSRLDRGRANEVDIASSEPAASASSTDELEQARSKSANWYVTIAIVIAVILVMLIQYVFDNTTEVTPDHSDAVVGGAMIAAALGAIITFALTARTRFRSDTPKWLSALILSFTAAVCVGLVAMFSIDRVFQSIDFPRSEIVQSVAYLPIERAYRTGSRNTDYNIQLAGPFANLDIDAGDYARAFNDANDVNPVGYCLRASVQTAGGAMRIMHSSVRPFAPGSVVKCPNSPTG